MLFNKLMGEEVQTQFGYDEGEDTTIVRRSQDTDPITTANKEDYRDHSGAFCDREGEIGVHVARIPLIVVEQWLKQGINVFDENNREKILQLLDRPEYQYLRTTPGKLAHRPGRSYVSATGPRTSEAEHQQALESGRGPGV